MTTPYSYQWQKGMQGRSTHRQIGILGVSLLLGIVLGIALHGAAIAGLPPAATSPTALTNN